MRLLILACCFSLGLAGWAFATPQPPPAEVLVTTRFEALPLRRAVRQLLQGIGVRYLEPGEAAPAGPSCRVEPDVPDVLITGDIRNVPLPAALRILAVLADTPLGRITPAREGNQHVIRLVRQQPFAAARARLEAIAAAPVQMPPGKRPFPEVMARLFEGTGVRWTLDPELEKAEVEPPEGGAARRLILRSLVEQLNRRYLIRVTEDPGTGDLTFSPRPIWDFGGIDELDLTWDDLPLYFIDAAEALRALGWKEDAGKPAPLPDLVFREAGAVAPEYTEGPSVFRMLALRAPGFPLRGIQAIRKVPRENRLLVHGFPEGIEQLKRVLRLIDRPRPEFRIRLTLGEIRASSLATSGTPVRLSGLAQSLVVSALCTVQASEASDVAFQARGEIRLKGQVLPWSSDVRLMPGRATDLGSFTVGARGRSMRLWVRVERLPPRSGPL